MICPCCETDLAFDSPAYMALDVAVREQEAFVSYLPCCAWLAEQVSSEGYASVIDRAQAGRGAGAGVTQQSSVLAAAELSRRCTELRLTKGSEDETQTRDQSLSHTRLLSRSRL